MPKAFAVRGSSILSTFWISKKWFPEPNVPICVNPLFFAFDETLSGSAFFIQPFSSQCSASSGQPNPCSIAQGTPLDVSVSKSCCDTLKSLLWLPNPQGTLLKIASARGPSLGRISFSERFVVTSLTPQLMSYPTPPGLITPSS